MIRQVCFFLSRACNLRCPYCKVPLQRQSSVLSLRKQKEVLDIIKNSIRAELVVLFGGEPLLYPFITDIVEYCHKINLPYALISNSTLATENTFNKLIKLGLKNYTASVDTLKDISSDDMLKKSSAGVKRLIKAKQLGVPDVVANTIITKRNIEEVPKIIEFFSKQGIWSILGIVHCGIENYWRYRNVCPDDIRLTKADKPRIEKLAKKLLQMKKQGYMIHNVDGYFKLMPKYYLATWHCSELQYLTVNEDGSLMDCPDFSGKLAEYKIWDFIKKDKEFDFKRMEKIWKASVKKCPGCFYNHMIQLNYEGKIIHSS